MWLRRLWLLLDPGTFLKGDLDSRGIWPDISGSAPFKSHAQLRLLWEAGWGWLSQKGYVVL